MNPVGPIAYLSFLTDDRAEPGKADDPWLKKLESFEADVCHCGHRPLRHMIIAPSYVRDVRDPVLLGIWRSALESLRQAARWIIIGYSLPPEDLAIRSMLVRAYQGRDAGQPEPDVTVVQKARKEPEVSRYQLLLPGHRYYPAEDPPDGLVEFLKEVSGRSDVPARDGAGAG